MRNLKEQCRQGRSSPPSSPPAAGRVPGVSRNSVTISGRGAIPRCGRTGKKRPRNVYAKTEAECEEKLSAMIREVKAEIAAIRSGAATEYPDHISPKKAAIAAYLKEHPGATSKSRIARELDMDRSTVRRYYDEIQAPVLQNGGTA